jgi:uncharacterized cysteine cluster protein YcgN (CxxCxxCC family)
MLKHDLSKLNEAEWENLCDGCGRCCLHKVEDETGKVYFTNVVCQYLEKKLQPLKMIRGHMTKKMLQDLLN